MKQVESPTRLQPVEGSFLPSTIREMVPEAWGEGMLGRQQQQIFIASRKIRTMVPCSFEHLRALYLFRRSEESVMVLKT